VIKIALIAYQDDREVITLLLALNSQDLSVKSMDLIETLLRSYREYEHKPLSINHVLLSHSSIFFLASGIEDVKKG
jgi:hypothetical protein